jgi:uncharacterized integral membrane protein
MSDAFLDPEERPQEERRTPTPDQPVPGWVWPLLFLFALITPVMILVFSNTGSTTIAWLGFEIEAPLYLILLVTFVAGAAGWPLLRWAYRRWRTRRRRLKAELDEMRRKGD